MSGWRTWITAGCALAYLAGCVSQRAPKSFSLVDYQRYQTELYPVAAETGRDLLQHFCFTPPPGCQSNSIACSIHPEYPGASWRYHYEVNRLPEAPHGKRAYYVRNVRLEPQSPQAYVFEPERPGRVVMWNNIARDPQSRDLVWRYLQHVSGEKVARVRLRYLDRMAREIAWHERQHVREGIVFNRELERIMNSPAGFPRTLVLASNEKPDQVLAEAIQQDRNSRIQELLARNAACAEKFHARENRADSYASILGQCACYGGWACQVKLPPAPRGDYHCDLPLPTQRRSLRVADLRTRR